MAEEIAEPRVIDALEADDDDVGESVSVLGDAASSTASISESILDYRRENGRTYHSYKDGTYHFPNDHSENERLDLQHHIFYLTFDGKLGLSPPCQGQFKAARVLDVGTGTGIWAIDFGDEYPESQIIGIDLSPTQPSFVPANVSFLIDDLEDVWTFSQPFDFIHNRMMNSSISDWPAFIKKSFDNLNPGGYLELQDFGLPLSDDGTLKPEQALQRSMALLGEAAAKSNHAFVDLASLKTLLTEAGFEDVTEVRYKWALNTWPRDKKNKELGLWNNVNMHQGMSGFLMAALTRGLGWAKEDVDTLVAQVNIDMDDRSIHSYNPIYIVYGRKPQSSASTG
ncbi:S-adenosyl-L-methionine-dependent methyltransferase [Thozetella sp. PMI_491]|nr:S-adenosyl-L-methionine-dependent methyltransferase [Thozetella sp. PMI_491]